MFEFQNIQSHRQILAARHPVALTRYVKKEMEWVPVHACRNTLVILTQDVDQNVFQIQTVIATRPVQIIGA